MEKYIMVVTDEQIERSKARRKAVESLEYNPMCYNCKNFGKSCKGSTNKIYSGCVYKEVDKSKKSIYAQILVETDIKKQYSNLGALRPVRFRAVVFALFWACYIKIKGVLL